MADLAKAVLLPEMEIELDEPIEFAGKSYSSVLLRESKAREVEQALAVVGESTTPDAAYRYQIMLLSKVSGLPRQVIEQFPVRKLRLGFNYVTDFLEDDGPKTGES